MKILNVFTNIKGEFGNPVGIMIDISNQLDKNKRQQLTTESGLSEVVFINDLDRKNVSIYSPQNEIPFAGHALVGAAYFLNYEYKMPVKELVGIRGIIPTWQEAGFTWVRSDLALLPPWNYEQLSNPLDIEKISLDQCTSRKHIFMWAWIDENRGSIRARTFASDWGIPEDEANGSGAMKLVATLGREITVYHGKGSIIHARPYNSNSAEVGGLVVIPKDS